MGEDWERGAGAKGMRKLGWEWFGIGEKEGLEGRVGKKVWNGGGIE
jgi:hypothetical protein